MRERTFGRAIARARLLAELEESVVQARGTAQALSADPHCTLAVGLLVAQLDRISAEVEQIRLGGNVANPDQSRSGEPRHWRSPPGDRAAE